MHDSQAAYRRLFDDLHTKDRGDLYRRVLDPWVESHPDERDWLARFASAGDDTVPRAEIEDLWRLYALGRVIETLLLAFQPDAPGDYSWPGPKLTRNEFRSFAESLGLLAIEIDSYSPFYHEIVVVDPAQDEREPVELCEHHWPTLMLGNMVMARGGVRISGGATRIRKDVAESSTLHWAYRRKNRPTHDLGSGWVSNSQWRTAFRRDYILGDEFHFNVDGTRRLDPALAETGDRIELLVHRCFVVSDRPREDGSPYDDTHIAKL